MARTKQHRALVVLVLVLTTVVLAVLVVVVLPGAPRTSSLLSEADAAEAGALEGAGHDAALAVGGELVAPLRPGRGEPVDVEVANTHEDAVRLTRVVVDIDGVEAPGATASRPCDVADFDVEQGSLTGVVVGPGESTRLSETGLDPARWPQVRMLDTDRNQDGCKRAVLVLGFSAQAVAR